MKRKINRLIIRIAEECDKATDAQGVVNLLSEVNDWDNWIKKARTARIRRERSRVRFANQRAKEKNLDSNLTASEWIKTLDYFNWRCAYCQEDYSYEHLEHFIPLVKSREGTTLWNCVPSCEACNNRKRTKDIDDWLVQPTLETMEDPFLVNLQRVKKYLDSLKLTATKRIEMKQPRIMERRPKYST